MRLRRVRWHCQQEGSETPIDRLLDEAESTLSEGVREMGCRLNQDASSFQKAAENLKRTAHVEVSKETLRQLVEGEGKAVLKAMQRAELMPDWSAEDCVTSEQTTRVYAGCDGLKVPLVTDEEKKKRRQGIRDKRRRRGRKCKPLPRACVARFYGGPNSFVNRGLSSVAATGGCRARQPGPSWLRRCRHPSGGHGFLPGGW